MNHSCSQCNSQLSPADDFCQYCGTPKNTPRTNAPNHRISNDKLGNPFLGKLLGMIFPSAFSEGLKLPWIISFIIEIVVAALFITFVGAVSMIFFG